MFLDRNMGFIFYCHSEPVKWKNSFKINSMTRKKFVVGARFIECTPVKLPLFVDIERSEAKDRTNVPNFHLFAAG